MEKQSTKDLVLHTLMTNWPASIKKIHNEVRKRRPVTYHAVYKLVKQMVSSGMLDSDDNGYLISKKWIDGVVELGQRLTSAYARKASGDHDTFVFNTVADTDSYLMTLDPAESQTKIVQCRHMWWALFRPETAFVRMQKDRTYKSVTYVMCSGSTLVDRWCASFERRLGKNVKLGVGCAGNCDVFVRGDTVIEVYYPKKLLDTMDAIYGKARKIDELNLKRLIEDFYNKQDRIMVSIKKSAEIAERIKQETLSQFGVKPAS